MNFRWPLNSEGNGLEQTVEYGRRLKDLGVNFLHVTNGFGFVCPADNPGEFPLEEFTMFCDSTRHLSLKAELRARFMHTPLRYLAKLGWKKMPPGSKVPDSAMLKQLVGLPVIVNGGFQERSLIEDALDRGCDLVSMARPLLANPELLQILRHREKPENPCTFCNRCDLRTSLFPVGCYDVSRFGGDYGEMEKQIIRTSGNPMWPHPQHCVPTVCVEQIKTPPAPRRNANGSALRKKTALAVAGLALGAAAIVAHRLIGRRRLLG